MLKQIGMGLVGKFVVCIFDFLRERESFVIKVVEKRVDFYQQSGLIVF